MSSQLELFTKLMTMSIVELYQARMHTDNPKMRQIISDVIDERFGKEKTKIQNS